jgi:hypothetical protein
MTLALYMDVHIDSEITARLRVVGVDVLTSQEDEADELSDEELLHRATALGRFLFTHDQDFLAIGAKLQWGSVQFPGIFYAHLDLRRNKHYAEWLEAYAKIMEPAEMANQVVFIS